MFFIGQNLSFLPYVFLLVTYLAGLSTVSYNLFHINSTESNTSFEIQTSPIEHESLAFAINEDVINNNTCFFYSGIEKQDYFRIGLASMLLHEYNPNNICFLTPSSYNSNVCTRPPPADPTI